MSESRLSLSTITDVTHLFEHVEFADMPAIGNMKVSTLRLFVQGLTEALRLLDKEYAASVDLGFGTQAEQDGSYFSLRDDVAELQVLGSRPVGKETAWGADIVFTEDIKPEPEMDDQRVLGIEETHVDMSVFGEEIKQCSCGLPRESCDYWDDLEDEDGVVLKHGDAQQEFLCRCGQIKLDCDFWDMEYWEHRYTEFLLNKDTGIEPTEDDE